jgi:hypothetical protein
MEEGNRIRFSGCLIAKPAGSAVLFDLLSEQGCGSFIHKKM